MPRRQPTVRGFPLRLTAEKSLTAMTKRFMRGNRHTTDNKSIQSARPASRTLAAHIDALPNEVLICVFEYAHAEILKNNLLISRSLREWTDLLLVCSRWRNVLRSVSHLWAIVPIPGFPSVLKDFVSLSGHNPVDLRLLTEALGPQAMALVGRARVASARSLTLLSADPTPFKSGFYDQILRLQLPLLEDLTIHAASIRDNFKRSLFRSQQQHPSLKKLTLFGLWAPDNITRLHTISFTACDLPFSFDDFIWTLSQCTQLVDLLLARCLPSLSVIPGMVPHEPRRARLEHLCKLTVHETSAHPLSVFLAFIETPSLASCHVKCDETHPTREDETGLFPDHPTILRRLFPAGVSYILPLFPPGHITAKVYVQDNWCNVLVYPESDHASPSLKLHAKFDLDWKPALSAALEDIAYLFSDIPITKLIVDGSPYYIKPFVWKTIFTNLTGIECLHLTGDGTWVAMWQGLEQVFKRGGLRRSRLSTVKIRHLSRAEEIHPAQPDERNLQIIAAALQRRLDVCGETLARLEWEAHSLHHPDYYAARGRFLARLDPMVGSATYEDLGQPAGGQSKFKVPPTPVVTRTIDVPSQSIDIHDAVNLSHPISLG